MEIRVDGSAARRLAAGRARARIADPDDQDLRPHRLEVMTFLEVSLQLADQLFLDVQHPSAHLADRMVMVAARELVVRGALPEVSRVDRAGCSESLQRS